MLSKDPTLYKYLGQDRFSSERSLKNSFDAFFLCLSVHSIHLRSRIIAIQPFRLWFFPLLVLESFPNKASLQGAVEIDNYKNNIKIVN